MRMLHLGSKTPEEEDFRNHAAYYLMLCDLFWVAVEGVKLNDHNSETIRSLAATQF